MATAQWDMRPSVGSWLLPPRFEPSAPEKPLVAATESAQPWNLTPSVGTWMMLLPPAAQEPQLAVHEKGAVAEEPAVADVEQEVTESARPWNFTPSVGTWMMPLPLPRQSPMCIAPALDEEEVEVDIRNSAFDLFWQQFDEQEAEER
eukprot:CAMPEP_0197620016 /NCGR_PEP_ID=MMETSP1338-20131121/921_1 /TAXON_ID=43686 ORGANISM="Pelagodinium beii, Strain RCC1491" /NCGR_SAMPLE_ID=MMETSP1338 /ASSEMBLY_ACC=CAM_ASM_000754 /LENGTH=146 /DNA_ID=CAMNT_0043189081 /DNA_START=408 /DNA_END=845 /DNA_ORIENTATION=-